MAFNFFKKKKKKETKKSQYIDVVIKEIVKETKDAVSVVFEHAEGFKYIPGQFITLILTINGNKIRRAYSLSSSPSLDEYPTITVKRVEGGIMSNYVNDELKAGDQLQIMEAMGSFTLDIQPQTKRQLFLLGGGSGITPLLSIAKTLLKDEPESKVGLIYANRDLDSIIFKTEIEQLNSQYGDRLQTIHYLENPPENWSGHQGYLTRESIKNHITELKNNDLSETFYMTCGPAPLMDIVWDTLEELNIPSANKFKESFEAGTTSPKEIIADSNEAKQVQILLEGEEYSYEVPSNKTILEAGLDAKIDMPYSCQSGLCTACRGKCLEGSIKMDEDDGLSDEEKAEGYVLLCVAHPETDHVKIEIG